MQKGLPREAGQTLIFVLLGIIMIAFVGVAFYAGKITPKPPETSVVNPSPSPSVTPSPVDEAANFNFIFKYGVSSNPGGPRNILNTSSQMYTKDMISGKDVTTKLSLTNEERKQILDKILSINLFDFPDNFSDNSTSCKLGTTQIPYSSYDLTVTYRTRIKHLSWSDQFTCKDNPNLEVQKLRELGRFIIDIIESKAEYKKLPPARGGYL